MKNIAIKTQRALFTLAILFSVLFVSDILSKPLAITAEGEPAVVSLSDEVFGGNVDNPFCIVKETNIFPRRFEGNYSGKCFLNGTEYDLVIELYPNPDYVKQTCVQFDFSSRIFTTWEILKTTVFSHQTISESNEFPVEFRLFKNYAFTTTLIDSNLNLTISSFHIVTFNGNGGTLVSGEEVQKVTEGESAVAPTYEREGYEFVGFDVDYENPTDDITVTAVWNESGEAETPATPETPVPEMNEGAAIRISGEKDNGIRFSANIPVSYVEEYENNGYTLSYGMFIVPADYLSDVGELTSENLFGENSVYVFDVGAEYSGEKTIIIRLDCDPSDDGEDNYVIKASIVNIHRTNLSRKFVARGYIAKTKGGVTEYEMINYYGGNVENNKRDVLSVAHAAYDDEETDPETKSVIYEIYLK